VIDGDRPLRAYLAPIADALADPATTEIVVNRPGEVGIEQRGEWRWRSVPEFTFERLDQIGILAGWQTGRDADESHPYVNTTLPDGQRIHICRPPATLPDVIAMTIRKPPATARRIDDADFPALFAETNLGGMRSTRHDAALRDMLAARDYRAFFRLARQARKTICVTGRTGSGKTDFLRRLLQETPETTRVVTLESDPEFGSLGPRNRVNLFYNDQHPEMQAEDAIKSVLRMYPTEVWFQEVRGPEAYPLLRMWAAGHSGGGTSWHAEEGREIEALMLMVRQHPAASILPDERLAEWCRLYIDIIVWCDRGADSFRAPRIWMKGIDA